MSSPGPAGRAGSDHLTDGRSYMDENPFSETTNAQDTLTSRRRSTRIEYTTTVLLSGKDASGTPFREFTQTLTVNLQGCKVRTSYRIIVGMLVNVECPKAGTSGKGVCVRVWDPPAGVAGHEIAVQLIKPQNLWGVPNPPADWELAAKTMVQGRVAPNERTGRFPAPVAPSASNERTGRFSAPMAPNAPSERTGQFPTSVASSAPKERTGQFATSVASSAPKERTGQFPTSGVPSSPTERTARFPAPAAAGAPAPVAAPRAPAIAPVVAPVPPPVVAPVRPAPVAVPRAPVVAPVPPPVVAPVRPAPGAGQTVEQRLAELERRSTQLMESVLDIMRSQAEELTRDCLEIFRQQVDALIQDAEVRLRQNFQQAYEESATSLIGLRKDLMEQIASRGSQMIRTTEDTLRTRLRQLPFEEKSDPDKDTEE